MIFCTRIGPNDEPALTPRMYDPTTSTLHVYVSYLWMIGSSQKEEVIPLPEGTRVVKFHPKDYEEIEIKSD